MTVGPNMQQRYRVRFDEAGPDGHLRSSGFLRYAQDLAWLHSELAGFGRSWYRRRGLYWLIRAAQLVIVDDVAYGAELDVSTSVAGFRRVWGRRRSEFRPAASGRLAAEATIDWVLLNARGVPSRIPAEILAAFGGVPDTFVPLRVALPDGPADATRFEFVPRHGEIDPMGHVNNAAYLDYLEQQLTEMELRADEARRPRRYQLEYVLPAEPGQRVVGTAWAAGGVFAYRLAVGEQELLRARLDWPPPGDGG